MASKRGQLAKADSNFKTELISLPYSSLVPAAWNYKTDGTAEDIAKLVNSIKHDGSAGVVAVRQIGKNKYEVMDGNHRHKAIGILAKEDARWKQVRCENFGKLTKAQAVVVAARRNKSWFADDTVKLSTLLNESSEEYSIDQLAAMWPESPEQLQSLFEVSKFDWESLPTQSARNKEPVISVKADDALSELWERWQDTQPNKDATEALRTALNIALIHYAKTNVPV
jgi:hypothetical protein